MLTFDAGSPLKNTNQCLTCGSFQPQHLEPREKNQPSQCGHNSKQRRRQMFCSLQILAQLPVFICANAHAWDCARGLFAWFISVLEKNSTIILLIKTMLRNDYNNSLKMNSAVKPLTRQHNRCD